jgi:hypothetical protein
MRIRIFIAEFFALVIVFAGLADAQTERPHLIQITSRGGSNCEEVASKVDSVFQPIVPKETVFVVAYKGQNEARANVERQRLRTAKRYLERLMPPSSDTKQRKLLVAAFSEERPKMGRLDFFVDGLITLRIEFVQNTYLALSPCNNEK